MGIWQTEVAADGPSAVWELGDGTTTMVDTSGNGHDGTHSTTLATATGLIPGSPSNGASTYASGNGTIVATGAWMDTNHATVEIWIKPTTLADQFLIGRDDNGSNIKWRLDISGGALRAIVNTAGGVGVASAAGVLTAGGTYCVGLKYGGAGVKLFLGGTQVAAGGGSGNLLAGPREIRLGVAALNQLPFVGVLDGAVVFPTALADARLAAHAAATWGSAPGTPTGLVADPALTSVDLDWVAPAGTVTSYEVRVNGGAPTNVGNVIAYTVSGLTPNTAYTFEVRALNAFGSSGWASVGSTTLDVPDPPTGLTQIGADLTSVDIEWVAPTGGITPTSYEYRVDGGTPVDVGDVLTAHISGLTAETTYTVEVRSVVSGGESSWVSLEATTAALPPPPAPASTVCSAYVRGSAIRVTGLDRRGQVSEPIEYAVSKSVVRVSVTDVVEEASNEMIKNPEEDRRLRLRRTGQTIRYKVDIEFLRVDPGLFSLVTGVPLVYAESEGFGEGPFGEGPFGGGGSGDIVGFDMTSTVAPVAFGLEVWSKLAGSVCVDGQRWGYTVFPYLRGGRLSGFQFQNGRVSFNLIGAQTRRVSRWNVGPHDIEGPFQRLTSPVSRNTAWRTLITSGAPPVEFCGIQTITDVLDNGTAANPMPDPDALLFVDGGNAETSAYIIYGGRA